MRKFPVVFALICLQLALQYPLKNTHLYALSLSLVKYNA